MHVRFPSDHLEDTEAVQGLLLLLMPLWPTKGGSVGAKQADFWKKPAVQLLFNNNNNKLMTLASNTHARRIKHQQFFNQGIIEDEAAQPFR